jgi:hypothetical protein
VDAVADAKRALSSHPLPDAAQPYGAAESVHDAQQALAAIPTEYDDDGPVPPLAETLAAVKAAKEVTNLAIGLYISCHFIWIPECKDISRYFPSGVNGLQSSHIS